MVFNLQELSYVAAKLKEDKQREYYKAGGKEKSSSAMEAF